MKAFKDYEIEDFIDMGSAHQSENTDGHIPFVPFCRTMEKVEYIQHPVSNLKDVLKAL